MLLLTEWPSKVRTRFGLHGPLDSSEAILELGIVLQAGLVGIVGADEVTLAVQGGAFAAPALGPVGLDLGGLLGVGQCVVPVPLGGVGC